MIATYIRRPVPFAPMEPNMNDELWRVQLGTGEIRTMTLDGLDQAFDEGLIDARVPVLAPGSSTWTTLGEAAGLEDNVVDQTPSLSPIAMPSSDSASSMGALPTSAESDLDLDLPDDVDFGRRPRGLLIGIIPGMLAVAAALVVVVSKLGGTAPPDVKVTNAALAPAAAEALPPAATAAAAPAEPAPTPEVAPAKPALSEWQKQLLEANDKAREEKAKTKAQEKAAAPRPKPAAKANPGLLNGGDRFDPLNGAL